MTGRRIGMVAGPIRRVCAPLDAQLLHHRGDGVAMFADAFGVIVALSVVAARLTWALNCSQLICHPSSDAASRSCFTTLASRSTMMRIGCVQFVER